MTGWWVWVLAATAALAPGQASAQIDLGGGGPLGIGGGGNPLGGTPTDNGYLGYGPPANGNTALPLYSTRPEDGGLFMNFEFDLYEMSNPLSHQIVALRGFIASDNSIPGATAGQFVGPANAALDVNQITGPKTFQPGFTFDIGYKFDDGTALTLSYRYLYESTYRAVATLAAPASQLRGDFAQSFLTADVFNFPPEYAGPQFKINQGGPEATFGIWNAASVMTIEFIQRFERLEAIYRIPVYETECYRVNGLVGPRFDWIWERFKWTTTDYGSTTQGADPVTAPNWQAIYTNIVSNRMYGAVVGFNQEYYVGHGFALMCTTEVAGLLDVVKERAKYELGVRDGPPQNKRAITRYTLVPEFEVTPAIMWYPVEGIQVRCGYDFLAMLNTISSPHPIDFNYSALDPGWVSTARFLDGFQASIALIF
jgi:hypothetical protein